MRVLLLNQTFYPDVAATAQHAHDLAKYLVGRGHQVAVVTSRSIYGKRGAILPRYEVVDGIEVHRVGMSLFGKSSILLRMLDFAFFYLLATSKVFLIKRPDVIVPFTTPPFIALVGWLTKTFKRCAYIYWVMDLYPDLPIACEVMTPRSIVARLCERINRFCLRHSDRAVVLGRCMKDRIIAKGIAAEKLATICVWSDADEVTPMARDQNPYRQEWSLGDAFVVMYSGNFGIGHDVTTMCEAAELLRDRADIRFVFAGGGKRLEEARRFIEQHGLTNIQVYPYQPRGKITASLGVADLHLISLADRVLGIMVPSKLYGIMAAQRPAIFIGHPDSEIARVLMENDCGLVIRCGESQRLAQSIRDLAADPHRCQEMGRRAREAMVARYDRLIACRQWEQLMLSCVGGPTSGQNSSATETANDQVCVRSE